MNHERAIESVIGAQLCLGWSSFRLSCVRVDFNGFKRLEWRLSNSALHPAREEIRRIVLGVISRVLGRGKVVSRL